MRRRPGRRAASLAMPRFVPFLPLPRRALVAGVLAWSCLALLGACSKPAAAPEPLRAVRTQVVRTDTAGTTLEYAAEVRARVESRLGFRVGGKLLRRSVELGDTVRAGQRLAQLDPQDLRLGQDSARAALASAQASQALAAADFKRYQELLAQGFISTAELERREATLKAAQATLDQARAQLAVQGNQADYAGLVADAAGVITGVDAEPGQVVAAGASVLRLAHDGPRDAVFSVPEDKRALLDGLAGRPGALRVRLWGAAEPVPATLREVAASADPSTRTFLAKADLGAAAARLGQTATVLVDPPRIAGVVRLPMTALMQSGGATAVWVLDGARMTVAARPVQVGGADGNDVVVAAGLAPGDEVVVAGVHVLTPGQQVRRYAETPPVAGAAAASR